MHFGTKSGFWDQKKTKPERIGRIEAMWRVRAGAEVS